MKKKPTYTQKTLKKRKDQDPWNNLQILGEKKIMTDHTTSSKQLAKKREIFHSHIVTQSHSHMQLKGVQNKANTKLNQSVCKYYYLEPLTEYFTVPSEQKQPYKVYLIGKKCWS